MNKLDSGDMYTVIAEYPKQFTAGLRSAEIVRLSPDVDRIIIVASSTDAVMAKVIASVFATDIKVPFNIHSSDKLPDNLTRKALVVVVDLAGKTPAALSALQEAYKLKCQIAVITAGGEAEIFARERGLALVLLPSSTLRLPTRMLSGYVLSALVQLLISAKVLDIGARVEILRSADVISQLYVVQQAKAISESIRGYLLLVYASADYAPVAEMAKIKFNLNCKLPCFWNILPEVVCSEAAGFNVLKNLRSSVLIFQDPTANELFNLQFEKLLEFFNKFNIKYLVVPMPGMNKLEKILGSILLTDWISYWLALSMNVDPTLTPLLNDFMLEYTQDGQCNN